MSNQTDRQASFRVLGSTTGTLEEDMLAAFAADSITTGTFNEQFYQWLGNRSVTGTLPERMHAFAVAKSADNWDSLGTFTLP